MSSEKTSSLDANQQPTSRISARPGSEAYESQFARQAGGAVHAAARVPIVRVVCGLLSIAYCLIVISSSFFFVKAQLVEGFQGWELLAQIGVVVGLWWLISMQGRIAIYGEFDTRLSLFAPQKIRA